MAVLGFHLAQQSKVTLHFPSICVSRAKCPGVGSFLFAALSLET